MGQHFVSKRTNERKKWGNQRTKTKYRKLPGRPTQGNELPTRADCLAKPKVARNSLPAEFYKYWLKIDVISLCCICWNFLLNSGDIDDRE